MNTVTRWDQSRGLPSLQEQVIRLFEDNSARDRSGHADLATWVPPVHIYETENELVIKADLPDLEDKDIDVHVEDNSLTINEDNHLLVERAYGPFTRSFSYRTQSVPRAFGPSIATGPGPAYGEA